MKLLLVSLFIVAVAVHATPEDATPYKTITGHRGADLPVRSAHMIPLGYHVQPSYALDYQQPTIHYNYGPAVRAEQTLTLPRAPLVMQPEVAFVPDKLDNTLASADDVPVYSNAPIPQPSRMYFQSMIETEAEADVEAEAEATAVVDALLETDADADADVDIDAEAAARAEAEAEDQANEEVYQAELEAEAEADAETEAEHASELDLHSKDANQGVSLAEAGVSAAATVTAYSEARRQAMEAEARARATERRIALLMNAAEIHKMESAREAEEAKISALINAERARDRLDSLLEAEDTAKPAKAASATPAPVTKPKNGTTPSSGGLPAYFGPKRLQNSQASAKIQSQSESSKPHELNKVKKTKKLAAKPQF